MTKRTFDILTVITTHLKNDDFGIFSNMRVRDLFPCVESDYMLHGVWLFYRSSINEVFYYTGLPCDKVYIIDRDPYKYVYLYQLL